MPTLSRLLGGLDELRLQVDEIGIISSYKNLSSPLRRKGVLRELIGVHTRGMGGVLSTLREPFRIDFLNEKLKKLSIRRRIRSLHLPCDSDTSSITKRRSRQREELNNISLIFHHQTRNGYNNII
jgi:hypothetical protein